MLKWVLPPSGVMKLNVDESIFMNYQKAGISCVQLQDAQGHVVMSATKPKDLLEDPLAVNFLLFFVLFIFVFLLVFLI